MLGPLEGFTEFYTVSMLLPRAYWGLRRLHVVLHVHVAFYTTCFWPVRCCKVL